LGHFMSLPCDTIKELANMCIENTDFKGKTQRCHFYNMRRKLSTIRQVLL